MTDETPRVYEMAKRHELPSKEVLRLLAAAALPARSASSKLTADQVSMIESRLAQTPHAGGATNSPSTGGDGRSTLTAGATHPPPASNFANPGQASPDVGPTDDPTYLRSLVLRAFEAAKVGGKEDWKVMSTAVLKNRISQLLNQKFDQRAFGYPRIIDMVKDFPDLLAIDETQNPPLALLLSQADTAPVDEAMQIRGDLWRAVLDFERREPYVFMNGQAVPRSLAATVEGNPPVLPTISPAEFDEWRNEFAESAKQILEGRADPLARLEDWVSSHQGTYGLPGVLRGHRNLYLKNAVIDRLRSWFSLQQIDPPNDMLIPSTKVRRPELARQVTEESLLRQALIECISNLTLEELRQVSLPAVSLIRRRP